MIDCVNCGRKLFSMADVTEVKSLGFALFGNCKHCNKRQSVASLWRRIKVQKYVELPKERKKRKTA